MKTLLTLLAVGIICASFNPMPSILPEKNNSPAPVEILIPSVSDNASIIYTTIQLNNYGLSEEAFDFAWKGYQNMLEKGMINRADYLTICDFSQSSRKKRMYVIDIAHDKLVYNTYVAHGRNSGKEYAHRFSNKPESLQSSLGFYVTTSTYIGDHGLSLHLNGVEPGYNTRALDRCIVIHGSNYVGRAQAKAGNMGRSFGCPAIPMNESKKIINTIKNGSCLFIYHPTKNYLRSSKILNG